MSAIGQFMTGIGQQTNRNVVLEPWRENTRSESGATRNGEIAQKSEDSVGPYNLQDFFLYYLVDHGFAPEKVLRLADIAYGDEFDHATLKKWLRSYCRRLFSQQFKRSCLQDGPTLNGFSFSPRTGFSMPSDGSDALYLATVDALK